MREQESVCEALQLLIWPSVKGLVGVRSLTSGGACHPKFVVPSYRLFALFRGVHPALRQLAAGSQHAHLFYRSRFEVPMYLCTYVPMSPAALDQMQLSSIGAMNSIPARRCLPPATIFW